MNDVPDIASLREKVLRAMDSCERHQRAGGLRAYYRDIYDYLFELDRRLERRDLDFDYLNEFPIGNIIVRVLDGDPDKETIDLLREIDTAFLKITRNSEYQQFLKDFDGLM